MSDEAQWRRVALASYGTQTLLGQADLSEWLRSTLFWHVRFQFRDGGTGALLAHDVADWLATLRARGACRISLVNWSGPVCCAAPVPTWDDCGLLAHWSDGTTECWASGLESEELAIPGAGTQFGRRAMAADLDSYWRVSVRAGSLCLRDEATPWPALWSRIREALFERGHRAGVVLPAEALCHVTAPQEGSEWAHWPVLPATPALPLAHRLLSLLSAEQGRFANDTHCKNEGNLYVMADAAHAAQITAWGRHLDDWLLEVQLRAANDGAWRGQVRGVATDWSPRVPALAGAPLATAAALPSASPIGGAGAGETVLPEAGSSGRSGQRWLARVGGALAWAVLALLLYAMARIIVAWPWLALALGALPLWGMWGRRR